MPAEKEAGSTSCSSGGMPADADAGSTLSGTSRLSSLSLGIGVKGAKDGVSGTGAGVFGAGTLPDEDGGIFSALINPLNLALQMLECLLVGASNLQARQPSVGPNLMIRSRVIYSLRLAVVSIETLENGTSKGVMSANAASEKVVNAASAAFFNGKTGSDAST